MAAVVANLSPGHDGYCVAKVSFAVSLDKGHPSRV